MQHYVHTLTGKTIVDFLSWLRTCRNNGSGAINRKISTVKMYIRFLASTDIPGAADVPIQYLQRARQPYAGPVKTLEIHEVKRILAGIDTSTVLGYRDFALFNLLYALGLRLSEALSLDLDAIDWKKRTCTVHGKGRKQRTLYLVKPLCDILVHYRQLRSELRNAQTSNAFFLSKKGNRLSARTAEENFQKLINNVGPFTIPRVTPHTLRHSFASHALENKEHDVVVIKAILGHACLKTTEIYLHPSFNMLKDAVNDHIASDILADLRQRKRTRTYRIQGRRIAA